MRPNTRGFSAPPPHRSPALVALAALALACAGKARPEAQSVAWCNVAIPAEASTLALPSAEPVATANDAKSSTNAPQWVVVWASWCKPCEAEWPRLERAVGLLRQAGVVARLTLLSIDTDADAFAGYLRGHPELSRLAASVVRARSPEGFEAWARRYGLSAAVAGLPFHLLAAADGKLACIHAGPLLDEDVGVIPRLVR